VLTKVKKAYKKYKKPKIYRVHIFAPFDEGKETYKTNLKYLGVVGRLQNNQYQFVFDVINIGRFSGAKEKKIGK